MEETKHTEGDWKLGEEIVSFDLGPSEVLTIIEVEGYGIIGYAVATPAEDKELQANAYLMAAASKMQEACKLSEAVLAEHEQYDDDDDIPSRESEAAEACRVALAKAEPTTVNPKREASA